MLPTCCKELGPTSQPLPSPAATGTERLGSSISETSLSTRDALDKYQIVAQKVEYSSLFFTAFFIALLIPLSFGVYMKVSDMSWWIRCHFTIFFCLYLYSFFTAQFLWEMHIIIYNDLNGCNFATIGSPLKEDWHTTEK